jgi:hypothetical protein
MAMKARIGEIEIDGTPEEIGILIRRLELGPFGNLLAHKRDFLQSKPEKSDLFVSEDVAFRVLKRRPLSEAQSKVLSLLGKSDSKWTSAKDIQAAAGYNASQLAGLFGAFGKRVSGTPGHIKDTLFFDQKWDYEKDCYKYRLPEGSMSAVKRAGI